MSRRRERNVGTGAGRSIPDLLYPMLDLHGRSVAEATRTAELWLRERADEGEAVVRLITGRGLHSVGPAVLPAAIEELLEHLKPDTVQGYEREVGGGAYRVRLRRSSTSTKSEGRPRAKLPADLMRLAEESLSELGIEPTPALVEAEARRLQVERERGRESR